MGQGRRLVLDWQPDDDVLALRAAYRACADPLVQPRLEALWLLRTGLSVRVAAVVVGVEERTVQRWVRWYRDGGRAALCAHPWAGGHGRASWLTDAQEQALVAHLATGAVFTAQDAVDWVAQRFQVTYTRDGMYSLFERLGCRPKVPRPHNPQRTPAAQEGWQKGGAAPRSGTRV